MEPNCVVTVFLWNHAKSPRVAAAMGDPDDRLRDLIAGLPTGSRVCVIVKRRGADNPQSYNYEWLFERPDLEISFAGHLNAHLWAIAAQARRERRGSQW